jgi:hypothetical protein
MACRTMQAIELFKRAPPQQLIASHSLLLQQCVAPRVKLLGGVWQYPEPRTAGLGLWSQQRLQMLVQQMLRLPLPGEFDGVRHAVQKCFSRLVWCAAFN